MRLTLHIGTEKTGTTSVQNWFGTNRQALVKQGVFYSRYLGDVSHMKMYQAALLPHEVSRGWRLSHIPLDERRAFLKNFPIELKAEIDQARALGCDRFVISNEQCHSRLQKKRQIKNLNNILSPLFDKIDVVMCLRPQVDVIVSRASTAARSKKNVSKDFFVKDHHERKFYDYLWAYEVWSNIFAGHNFHVVPFQRNANMLAYFQNLLGIDPAGFKMPPRQNEALDIRTVAMLNFLRPQYNRAASEPDIFRRRWLNQLPVKETMQIGPELAHDLQSVFEAKNQALCAACPSLEMADFTFKAGRYDAPSNLNLLSDPTCFEEQKAALAALLEAAGKTPPVLLA